MIQIQKPFPEWPSFIIQKHIFYVSLFVALKLSNVPDDLRT